jgi:hypothetical protein
MTLEPMGRSLGTSFLAFGSRASGLEARALGPDAFGLGSFDLDIRLRLYPSSGPLKKLQKQVKNPKYKDKTIK